MPTFNNVLREHTEYCKEILADNTKSIELFESGSMRIGDGSNDLTSTWVASLKRHNDMLRRVIARFEETGDGK